MDFYFLVMETHTHTVLTAIFPGEPGLAGCLVNSSPFIPGLRIFLGQYPSDREFEVDRLSRSRLIGLVM